MTYMYRLRATPQSVKRGRKTASTHGSYGVVYDLPPTKQKVNSVHVARSLICMHATKRRVSLPAFQASLSHCWHRRSASSV